VTKYPDPFRPGRFRVLEHPSSWSEAVDEILLYTVGRSICDFPADIVNRLRSERPKAAAVALVNGWPN
jgi:hypothetical protein